MVLKTWSLREACFAISLTFLFGFPVPRGTAADGPSTGLSLNPVSRAQCEGSKYIGPPPLPHALRRGVAASLQQSLYKVCLASGETREGQGAYLAKNYSNAIETLFEEDGGVHVSTKAGNSNWRCSMRFASYGWGEKRWPDEKSPWVATDNRIERNHGDLLEWYRNDVRGLEQGFTISSAPGERDRSSNLDIELFIESPSLCISLDRDAIHLLDSDDRRIPIIDRVAPRLS